MSGNTVKIFILGGTGYIGGSFLVALMAHRLEKVFEISVLARSEAKAEGLRALGIRAVVGSLADLDLIAKETSKAEIVFSCANSDDMDSVNAILAGMKTHFEQTGVAASLIHTSGTGVMAEDTKGMSATETIYSDLDTVLLDKLAPTQPHRAIDLAIFEADAQGYVKTYVVAPGLVHGRATGLLVDRKIQGFKSIQLPALVQIAVARGQAGMVGAGQNRWGSIGISDLTDLFVTLFDTVLATHLTSVKAPAEFKHGREGFYNATSDEQSLYQITQKIGQVLNGLGIGSAEPTKFSDAELAQYPILTMALLGANARASADRMAALGWVPKYAGGDVLASVEVEVKDALKAQK